jgi:hypothetical protein
VAGSAALSKASLSALRKWIVEDVFECDDSDDIDEESLVAVFLPFDKSGSGVVTKAEFVSIFKSEDLGIELTSVDVGRLVDAFGRSGGGAIGYRDFIGGWVGGVSVCVGVLGLFVQYSYLLLYEFWCE